MKEKITIVVDSGTDITPELIGGLDIVSLPLRITIDNKSYIDRVDITSKEVFAALDTSKVMSSLPSGEDIIGEFEKLKASGTTHIVAITISSGLSGTNNVIRTLSEQIEGLTVHVVDTLNISLGAGLLALEAGKWIKEGLSFDEVVRKVEANRLNSTVFFTVGSLEYLQKGGRIGLVAGTVANVLNIKPVISCNEEGIYYTVTKIRGYGRAIHRMIDTAAEFAKTSDSYRVVIMNADTKEDLNAIKEYAHSVLPKATSIEIQPISPALGIHTGPEAIGIAIYRY